MTREEVLRIKQITKDSASFNIVDITNILAILVSEVEGEAYAPIIYSNNYWNIPKHVFAIAKKYISDDWHAHTKYTNIDFGTYVHNLIVSNSVINIYNSVKVEKIFIIKKLHL